MAKVLSETDSERLGLAFYRAIGAVIDANPDVDPWDLSGALGKAVHVFDKKKDRLCRHAVARAATYETEESVAHAVFCAIGEVLNNHIDMTREESSTAVGTAIRVLAQFGFLNRELVSQAAASDEPFTSLLSEINVRPRLSGKTSVRSTRKPGGASTLRPPCFGGRSATGLTRTDSTSCSRMNR